MSHAIYWIFWINFILWNFILWKYFHLITFSRKSFHSIALSETIFTQLHSVKLFPLNYIQWNCFHLITWILSETIFTHSHSVKPFFTQLHSVKLFSLNYTQWNYFHSRTFSEAFFLSITLSETHFNLHFTLWDILCWLVNAVIYCFIFL